MEVQQKNHNHCFHNRKWERQQEQDIIPLYTKDDLPPVGAPISDDETSDEDYFAGSPHTESEGYFFNDVAPTAPPIPLPSEAPNIDPGGATVPPPDPYPEGEN